MGSWWLAWMNGDARIEREATRWLVEMSNDPEGTRPGLERWLAGDPRRRKAYAMLAGELVAASHAAATLERGAIEPRPSPHASRSRPLRLAATSACLVLVFGAAIVLVEPNVRSALGELAFNLAPATDSEMSTAPGEVKRFRLTDGSTILLDGDSLLKVAFDDSRRATILERGRARFDVADDAARPFMVTAAGGTVTANDARFDIWLRPDSQVRVVLLKGTLDVKAPAPSGTRDTPKIALKAGQRLVYGATQQASANAAKPATASTAEINWMNEHIDFNYVPLREVVLEANRHSRAQIELAEPDLGDIEVFGIFQIRDTARLAHKLADSLDLDVRQDGDRLILSARKRGTGK